ncbi:hypothetical protein ACOJTA_11865 [Malaciobacter sp. WC5094]|uniref:hypothetical protein n=1 Tax=Arcobacter sp. YIC-80 TaxID=3376683 RepID=UPI00384AE350
MSEKKEKEDDLSGKIFKILVALVILVFFLVILKQPSGSFSFSQNKLREPSSKTDSRPSKSVPSELKWTDPFKGISNEER